MGQKLGGLYPFGEGELVPILYNVAGAEAYPHVKFHLDPSNRLATIYQRHRQTDRQDRQWIDSIGRTVCKTVAQQQLAQQKQPQLHYSVKFYMTFCECIYTVSQKNDTDVAHYNFNAHQLILVIFGRDVAETACFVISPLLTNVSALPWETRIPEILFSLTVANWVFAKTTHMVGLK